MKRALVTGASGFVGVHLVRYLLELHWNVTCVVRDASRVPTDIRSRAKIVQADICESEQYAFALQGLDCVFHLAAVTHSLNSRGMDRVNVAGSLALLDAAAALDRAPVVVFVSSLAASGPSPSGNPCNESTIPSPVSAYGRSKLAAEQAARSMADRVPITIVRPGVIFGSGSNGTWHLLAPIVKFGIHLVPGWNTRRLSMTHVRDFVHLLTLCYANGERLPHDKSSPISVGVYCVGTDEQPTYVEVGKLMGDAVGRGRPINFRIPNWTLRIFGLLADSANLMQGKSRLLGTDKVRELVGSNWTCDVSKIQQQLKFAPNRSLAERWRETAASYCDRSHSANHSRNNDLRIGKTIRR